MANCGLHRRSSACDACLGVECRVLPHPKPITRSTLMSTPASEHSRSFVLVHGAWHGGWCWKRVSPLLRSSGHEVFTPTLTGLGERQHLMSRDVGLDTHIQDVLGVLEYEDLYDVVLVGHSYA